MRYPLKVRVDKPYDQILIATTNRGKAVEISKLLDRCATEFINLSSLPPVSEPEEDGSTFVENARKKARYYSVQYNMPTVADDSGLMVDALDGAPGVLSSRLVPPGCGDEVRNEKLLKMIKHVTGQGMRSAKFVCAACFVDPGRGLEFIEEGVLTGHIATGQSGDEGFGFDPILIPEGYDKSIAQLGLELKNRISHRKQAFEKIAHRIDGLQFNLGQNS